MCSGAWCCLIAGIWLSACSGDYPLAPTACDEYCRSTKDLQCAFYDPASCVSQCERDLKGDEACRGQLNAVLGCFASENAEERRCHAFPLHPEDGALCDAEINQLDTCSSALRIANDPQPGKR